MCLDLSCRQSKLFLGADFMSKQAVKLKVKFDDQAEGSPARSEREEPFNPFKTGGMLRLNKAPNAPTSDVGTNAVVDSDAEAVGADEMQDGSVNSGESLPKKKGAVMTFENDREANEPYTKPILIVEDTAELAEVIQATLESMGLHALTAAHGEIGLDKYKAAKPEIILLDIGLPDMTGWKFLDAIKEMKARKQIDDIPTIIVITAYDDAANRLVGKLQGIHSYLIKPFTPDHVEQLVAMAIRGERPDDIEFHGHTPME